MFTSLHIEGNLISEDLLQQVAEGTVSGQQAIDFGLEPGSRLNNEIEYSWSRIRLEWKRFSAKRETLSATDPYGTTLARRWMEDFFKVLGFDLERSGQALEGSNGQRYSISHIAANPTGMPIHIVGFVHPDTVNGKEINTLDVRSSGGASRLSPHSTVQEYLNVTDHVYGLVTNGLQLRLLRDSGRLVKLTYLEFDLRRILEQDQYADFTLLYRLLHSSRFGTNDNLDNSWLNFYYKQSIETGNRIREGLSKAVKETLMVLGNGFLTHQDNEKLRQYFKDGTLDAKEYYRELLRLVYRLLFLLVTEERDLVYDPDDKGKQIARYRELYREYYSLTRLRRISELRYLDTEVYTDLWPALQATFRLFEAEGNGERLGIQPLGGHLFSAQAIPNLSASFLTNQLLLSSLRNMNEFWDPQSHTLVTISYRALDVEELGSVYEGLLDLHPVVQAATHATGWTFLFHEGTDRKTTGSYYTRQDLVNELIKSALIPVIEEKLQSQVGNREAQAKAILALKVCDPATGSGHMLLSAARTIAWYLARVKSGDENPGPSIYRACLRQVIQHCIYAVDYNPDAVELCKLALWLESHNSGKPLSFLDHKIRIGNSLVGVTNLSVLTQPLPDDAFAPISGDDIKVCKELKKRNAQYRKTRQASLFSSTGQQISQDRERLQEGYAEIEGIEQDNLEATRQVAIRFEQIRRDISYEEQACNIWTAAFFKTYKDVEDPDNPSSERLTQYFGAPADFERLIMEADSLKKKYKFFHWPLEFPDVWAQGGFDVMLGNPPWERIKLQQQEYFATRDNDIASAPNASARNRLIDSLIQSNPSLYNEYIDAVHGSDATGKFLRESGRYELTAVGDINTYSVFSELFSSLTNKKGRAGFIVPTGIATDDSNKIFFGNLVEQNKLLSLFDFENREAMFPDVHRSYKFCLLTIAGSNIGKILPHFGFLLTQVSHLQDTLRIFSLSKEDFIRLNPNTKTCPLFRTRIDAELTTKIYQRLPVLINEVTGENPWEVTFFTMFHMSNDSHLFCTKNQLELDGFQLWGNRFKLGEEIWLPLYEAKMISHYDHRFGSYAGVYSRTSNQTPTPSLGEYEDPIYQVLPWYWVKSKNVESQTDKKWHIGFRDIARNTDERTAIFSIIPKSGVGNQLPLLRFDSQKNLCLFYANMASLVFDYLARQKVGGTHINFFYLQQFAILPPGEYDATARQSITIRVLELAFTSWDIKPFADEIWEESDQNLRSHLEHQWHENASATGGHPWTPPEWCEDFGLTPNQITGYPFPPFKWDEERRAILKAELDAIFAKQYGLTTDELRYILDPQDVYGTNFPGETFRVLKEKEIRQLGEYRTKRLVLEAWERLNRIPNFAV
ncbi:MAG: hypothetical protein J0H74_04195 [Chitinophagaceae bacterium]|nr:hypothetical protein [Chitinophagaceae bacterium]